MNLDNKLLQSHAVFIHIIMMWLWWEIVFIPSPYFWQSKEVIKGIVSKNRMNVSFVYCWGGCAVWSTLADLDKADDNDEGKCQELCCSKEVLYSGGCLHAVAVHEGQQHCRQINTGRLNELCILCDRWTLLQLIIMFEIEDISVFCGSV